jgi:pimeloyl-ACP methyl ester carboxylesterase
LKVPVDYHNPNGETLNLSIIRFKATKFPSKGPIFINPGGPGGSGVDFVSNGGKVLSKLVGGHYDIIGFDPRGIGRSNTIRCFKDGTDSQLYQANRPWSLGPGENAANFAMFQQALANQCIDKNRDFLPYVSTAAVARDLDSLRDAFGQELTNYWGFSYGTFLGATYANMFPDRVGRVILDGVADPTIFVGEVLDLVTKSIIHTEDCLDKFGASCEAAGPNKCSLAHPKKALAHNGQHYVAPTIRKFLEEMSDKPILARNMTSAAFVVQSQAATMVFATLYNTYKWPLLADALASAIYKSDGTSIAEMFAIPEDDRCPATETYSLSFTPVVCIDGHHNDHKDVKSWMKGVRKAALVSPLAGPVWGTETMSCLYWNVTAAERYAGPWNHRTKNKVLIIGGTGDPVTPVESAEHLEQLMEGSGVFLKHEGWGHSSLGQPSKCTTTAILEYFENGTLPAKGASCQASVEPFETTDIQFGEGISYADMKQLAYALE